MVHIKITESVDAKDARLARLAINEHYQTKSRGTNNQEYEIYKTNAESLGWTVKTFEEWINS
jgi:hypothetical protein